MNFVAQSWNTRLLGKEGQVTIKVKVWVGAKCGVWQPQNVAPHLHTVNSCIACLTVWQPTNRHMCYNNSWTMLCSAVIDFNAYRHEQTCHELIILLVPARLYASQIGGSCCVKPTAVLHVAPHMDGCTSHVYCIYSYNDDWFWLSGK